MLHLLKTKDGIPTDPYEFLGGRFYVNQEPILCCVYYNQVKDRVIFLSISDFR